MLTRGRSNRGCSDDSTKAGTVLWNSIFPGRFGNGRNVCIHPTTVEQTGLYCSNQPFVVNDLIPKVECQGQAMWAELEAEQQTPLVDIRRSTRQFEVPPPLPAMDEPAVYVVHPDVMQVNTRKNYVRDRMRAALMYISEYVETKYMMTEGRYNNEELLVRLRAVFGRVDQVRDHIDRALQQDDAHRRKRDMRFLVLPTRFPRPEVWVKEIWQFGQTGYMKKRMKS